MPGRKEAGPREDCGGRWRGRGKQERHSDEEQRAGQEAREEGVVRGTERSLGAPRALEPMVPRGPQTLRGGPEEHRKAMRGHSQRQAGPIHREELRRARCQHRDPKPRRQPCLWAEQPSVHGRWTGSSCRLNKSQTPPSSGPGECRGCTCPAPTNRFWGFSKGSRETTRLPTNRTPKTSRKSPAGR